ncbi:1387_t:CDS:2, partial [Cetraspora pellucida]
MELIKEVKDNNSTLQNNIQISVTDNNFYQNLVEFNLNSEKSLQIYQDYKNNLKNYSNFNNNLEVDKFGSRYKLEDNSGHENELVYKLKNGDKLEDCDKLVNSLESRNKFDDDDELINSLKSKNKVENNNELGNSLESKNEFENNIELENRNSLEGSDKYMSRLKYKDSNNKSESDSNNSTIRDTSNIDIK